MTTEKRRKRDREIKARQRAQNVADKKYYCEKCDKAYVDSTYFGYHLKSTKHIEGYVLYECKLATIYGKECNFKTIDKTRYSRHLKTKKHDYGRGQAITV